MAISSLIKLKELLASFGLLEASRCSGALKPKPAAICPGRRPLPGFRSRFDCTRLRSLDLENSLTAYNGTSLSANRQKRQAEISNACPRKDEPYDFMSKLVNRQMHRAKAPSPNLLLDDILVYSVDRSIVAATVLRSCVQCLLDTFGPRRRSSMMSCRTLVGRRGPYTP